MKKLLTISLLVILLLSFQAPGQQAAYYSSTSLGPTLPSKTWVNFSETWFSDRRDGVVNFVNGFWFSHYDGLVDVSGTCSLKYEPEPGYWAIWLNNGGTLYRIVNTNEITSSFDLTVPVTNGSWIQMSNYQEYPYGSNSIKCTMLFEPVY
jgi:hypothetical protein